MSTATPRQLHLNVNAWLQGFVPSAWRVPENDPLGFIDVQHYVRIAQWAEKGKFDAIFLADSVTTDGLATGPVTALEPTLVLTAIAMATTHLGLVATASTTYNDPYNLARRLASLDLISGGRAGWNVVTTADASSARKFGQKDVLAHTDRYRRADEFATVVKALWNSWEDDALLGDAASGRFVDTARLNTVHHAGEFFQVEGVLNQPRSPQGHPVIFQAGGSADGQALAARHAEAVFSASQSFEEALAYAQGLRRHARALGRSPDGVKVLPGLGVFLGGTQAEARQRHQELINLVPVEHSLNRLAGRLGVAPEQLKLDEPLPQDLPLPNNGNGGHTFFRAILARSQQSGLTLREFLGEFAAGGGHREIVGTPEQVADDIEHWFRHGAADGFNLMPGLLPSGLQDFVEQVVPLLQQRGLFRQDYAGRTLRQHLGLPVPQTQTVTTSHTASAA
ncbi:LLM class flavin-dependent oxidoreductase [Kerstersia gyiorum]|uniref:LLM class flavin-dependent oxidoreductase n=1 Tax=Kerstersia gyiorum TaxID=206506 RepID=UPI00209D3769|nr:LLM class flavin-dependent oxidoreductase [Kerstersia gyiorum]MCP1634671.1 FMN-dependent oxidoreductase (nitrilotriacetate monooxygenase family) [Kerstersia gyiorum]MCP1636971.1 FMN-dependent oxidoreductase (nitrilotriacetate monooxygenase family) [Kerstersia gyiorum]MCP1678899.1 FMN-dependent oxidoreductase (nitrilotriacetate monooxygenase family) [Kerstersia gyiorum]MCP1683724.1 FMN-dependent oxidoreductase (nitrilotriacetate monooxygenase family) [Kerstersia gyiorum]MCP1712350.1 FMN-depe